jgi:hypothetical protein
MRGDILALGAVGALAVAGLARRGASNEEQNSLRAALWVALGSPPHERASADWAEEVWGFGRLQAVPGGRYRLFLFPEESGEMTLLWRLKGQEVSLLGAPAAKAEDVDDDTFRFKDVKHFPLYSVADVRRAATWLNENVPVLLAGEIPRGGFE